ncbi:unnamed protein product [Nippostrongylus brasiliensis]|uniref:Secreted protein n=1 Tax=Nippostrongylus brasiliensis TaxID=27835 RepID=A0A0N4YCT1_NIPBR|nr:unnamed protein product [Nippostrongylus brasiliensis]
MAKFLHLLVAAAVLSMIVDAIKMKKPRKEHEYVQIPSDLPRGEPRYVKVLTEYDKCKMECKRQRDAVNRKEYLATLREELAALEAQEAAEAAAKATATAEKLSEVPPVVVSDTSKVEL